MQASIIVESGRFQVPRLRDPSHSAKSLSPCVASQPPLAPLRLRSPFGLRRRSQVSPIYAIRSPSASRTRCADAEATIRGSTAQSAMSGSWPSGRARPEGCCSVRAHQLVRLRTSTDQRRSIHLAARRRRDRTTGALAHVSRLALSARGSVLLPEQPLAGRPSARAEELVSHQFQIPRTKDVLTSARQDRRAELAS